jgi:hypothetical protein
MALMTEKQSSKTVLSIRCFMSFLALLVSWTSHAATPLPAMPGSHNGVFVVEDALNQFVALKHHGEALAWRNIEASGAPDPTTCDHYQGIARYPGPAATPVFYVTQSDTTNLPPACLGGGQSDGGYINVVSFGSRGGDGERLRSNLQQIGNDTEEAYPPTTDTWVRSIRLDGTLQVDGVTLDAFKHPGGPAIIDGYLLVPVDQPLDDNGPTGMILFFDLADPLDPQLVNYLELEHGIDNIGATRRDDGSYLIWTNGDGGDDINIYTSAPGADLGVDPLTLDHTWDDATGLSGQTWPTGASAHQSSAFLREPDGSLFLVALRHPGGLPTTGSDWADLYSVTENPGGQLSLAFMGEKHLYCNFDAGGGLEEMRLCNMTAAGGIYVTPTGELILYGSPHDDEDGFSPDIVRMGEFRHRDVLRPNNPLRAEKASSGGPYTVEEAGKVQLNGTIPDYSDPPWVELYDDTGYLDRSIVVDYVDRNLLELNNFNNLDGFNDKTSSVRWRAPVGLDIRLYEHDNYGGSMHVLTGTGQTQAISNLDDVGFGDKTSSLSWVGSPTGGTPLVEWDLDGDNVFGETGSAAMNGPERGSTPVFNAAELDGPHTVNITMRVKNGTDITVYPTTVKILNVAPGLSVRATVNRDPGGGGEVGLVIDVDEPGKFDKSTIDIDWGDGNQQQFELGYGRHLETQHGYATDHVSGALIRVEVDDGEDTTVVNTIVQIAPDDSFADGFEN